VSLPLLIFPCAIKSRSSLLASAHLGGPGKRAVKRLYVCVATILVLLAFALLRLVSSVLSQEISWEERLRNDLFWVEWDVKP